MQLPQIKNFDDFKYYTGNYPEIKAHYRAGRRPTEFGNKVWPTSLVLMEYLKTTSLKLNGLRVLEIGCGWGIVGAYLAQSHSCRVTCTDIDESVLPIVSMHGKLNKVSIVTERMSFKDMISDFLESFDLIVGAEVCYSEDITEEIVALMERAFKAGVQQVLIADPGRPGFDNCYEACANLFETELIDLPGTTNGKQTYLLSARTGSKVTHP